MMNLKGVSVHKRAGKNILANMQPGHLVGGRIVAASIVPGLLFQRMLFIHWAHITSGPDFQCLLQDFFGLYSTMTLKATDGAISYNFPTIFL